MVKRVIIEGSTTSVNVAPLVALTTVLPALPIKPKAIGKITATTIKATANKITSFILAIFQNFVLKIENFFKSVN